MPDLPHGGLVFLALRTVRLALLNCRYGMCTSCFLGLKDMV